MGPGQHIVVYYVAGKRLLNFVGIIEQDSWTGESWTDRGDVNDLRTAFADWDTNLRAIIETIDETFIWGMFDRAPLPRWSAGRVTLLGDACHPMLPFMAQGAAQALEDGASLTACLTKIGDVPAVLTHYEKMRLPRTSRIQAYRLPTKPASICSTGPPRKNGTQKWQLAAPIDRSRRLHGSTTTTPPLQLKPGTSDYHSTRDWSELWVISRHVRRKKEPTLDHLGATHGGGPSEEPWVTPIISRIRDALVRHGVDPSVHSGGRHVNEHLTMAMHGATDEELAAAADRLKDEHILRDEEPEEEPPGWGRH